MDLDIWVGNNACRRALRGEFFLGLKGEGIEEKYVVSSGSENWGVFFGLCFLGKLVACLLL